MSFIAIWPRSWYRRRDDVDLLSSDRPAVAGVRIEPRNCDARRRDTRGLQVSIGDGDGSANALAGDCIGDLA